MNNSVYGKISEILRKRIDVPIVKNDRRRLRCLEKPNRNGYRIFDNDVVAIKMAIFQLEISKRTYVGFCVLELSKHLMFDFHYNFY